MWLRQILAITAKDLKIFFKDLGAVVLIFLMPLIFVVLMSYALAGQFASVNDQQIRVEALDQDQAAVSKQLIEQLQASPAFQVEHTWGDRDKLEADVASGRVPFGLIIPSGFSASLHSAQAVTVELVVDPSTPNQVVAPIQGTVAGLIERAAALAAVRKKVDALFAELGSQMPLPVMAVTQKRVDGLLADAGRTGPGPARIQRRSPAGMQAEAVPDTFQQNVPGYTLFGIFWIVILLAESVLLERREGTFRRLLVSPIRPATLLAGKLVPFYLINLMQVALMLGSAALLFDMDLGPSLGGLVLVSLAASAAAVGLGVLVAALARSEARTRGLTILVLLTLAAVGGCFVPRFIMPEELKLVGLATPHAWALDAYQDLLVRGRGLVDVLPKVGVLGAFAAVFFGLGVWRFKFD